jgi:hypothetical protein
MPCAEDAQELPPEMCPRYSHHLLGRANVMSCQHQPFILRYFKWKTSIGAVGNLKSHDYDKAHRWKASIPTWQFHRRIHSRSKFMNGLHQDRMFVLPNTIFPNNFRKHFDYPWSVFLFIYAALRGKSVSSIRAVKLGTACQFGFGLSKKQIHSL